jgi:hypothetical protein
MLAIRTPPAIQCTKPHIDLRVCLDVVFQMHPQMGDSKAFLAASIVSEAKRRDFDSML